MPQVNSWPVVCAALREEYREPFAAKSTWQKLDQCLRLLPLYAPEPADVDRGAIIRLAADLANGRRASTVNSLLRCCRTICGFLVEEGLIVADPFQSGRRRRRRTLFLREGEPVVRALGKRELAVLLERAAAEVKEALSRERREAAGRGHLVPARHCTGYTGQPGPIHGGRQLFQARRIQALAVLIAYTGLRLREALYLERAEVLDSGRLVIVSSRNHRLKTTASAAAQVVPEAAAGILRDWCNWLSGRWLFPCLTCDRPWLYGNQRDRPLGQLKALAARAGIEGVTFQGLRHSYATQLEGFGLGEAMIQRLMRHASPQTQRRYRHADLVNLQAAMRDLNYAGGT